MLNRSYFHKKFSVGLALRTDCAEFDRFLDRYHSYIDNVYFSLPLGDRFHCRSPIAEQFHDENTVALFWRLLESIRAHGIKLEVVFNTHLLDRDDISAARAMLDAHDIQADKVAIQHPYYAYAKEWFPLSQLVLSVNNMPNDKSKLLEMGKMYDEVVVGRQFIRDSALFEAVRRTGAECVLLLNNGCSHTCGGCRTIDYCRSVFLRDSNITSPQDVYARQSILPYELHEGFFDIGHVSLLKLSTRNADLPYMEACLKSYIENSTEQLVKESSDYYLLWSRLAWPIDFFESFDYNFIKFTKQAICK